MSMTGVNSEILYNLMSGAGAVAKSLHFFFFLLVLRQDRKLRDALAMEPVLKGTYI